MSEVVVHFNSKRDGSGRRLVAVALFNVRGVIIGKGSKAAFLAQDPPLATLKKMPGGEVPSAIQLKMVLEDGTTEPTDLVEGEDGPEDVCYWVGPSLFCWE
jgi:hypothetical protein